MSGDRHIPTLFDLGQGGGRPAGRPEWACSNCGSRELLVRWEAFGSQVGAFDHDGLFVPTLEMDVYECEPWELTCAECDESVEGA